ncbi:hypothetical protein PRVXH_001711 [Proteinivorax hydrogeniformans]|uniref:Uncharacterized protein n=1 Tax=Proteinivorax hydrogeniformans TaxID=1826727 RepID=A0AAU8HQE7_9FIRM
MMTRLEVGILISLVILVFFFIVKSKLEDYKSRSTSAKPKLYAINLLEQKGYKFSGYCSPKKICFFKDNVKSEDLIKSVPIVKKDGKAFLVESMPKNRSLSLKDNFIKVKILKTITCYNDIDGIVFVETKNKYVKECTVDIRKDNQSYILRLAMLVLFVGIGFLIAKLVI